MNSVNDFACCQNCDVPILEQTPCHAFFPGPVAEQHTLLPNIPYSSMSSVSAADGVGFLMLLPQEERLPQEEYPLQLRRQRGEQHEKAHPICSTNTGHGRIWIVWKQCVLLSDRKRCDIVVLLKPVMPLKFHTSSALSRSSKETMPTSSILAM